ncbi:hypothetical protein ABW19_dt0203817 [Dactylella cylindrospora]|nr:hypothetical protein ABW19_dt0203817 [Dactylella cylindrospora]
MIPEVVGATTSSAPSSTMTQTSSTSSAHASTAKISISSSTVTPDSNRSGPRTGISSGVIAGIVAGVIGAIAVGIGLGFLIFRRRGHIYSSPSEAPPHPPPGPPYAQNLTGNRPQNPGQYPPQMGYAQQHGQYRYSDFAPGQNQGVLENYKPYDGYQGSGQANAQELGSRAAAHELEEDRAASELGSRPRHELHS